MAKHTGPKLRPIQFRLDVRDIEALDAIRDHHARLDGTIPNRADALRWAIRDMHERIFGKEGHARSITPGRAR